MSAAACRLWAYWWSLTPFGRALVRGRVRLAPLRGEQDGASAGEFDVHDVEIEPWEAR